MTVREKSAVGSGPGAGEQARADVYRLLGALLARPPDEEIMAILLAIETDEAPDTPMAEGWRELVEAARHIDVEQAREEYFNLFIGLGRGELVPYASRYIDGFLMEQTLASLRSDLARLGIERRENVVEPEDHVAALCETMGMILSEHELHSNLGLFFEAYIGSWMERFFADLSQVDSAVFYRAVGRLGSRFLDTEAQYLTLRS